MRSEGVGLVFVLADRAPRLGIILLIRGGARSMRAVQNQSTPPHGKGERRA